MRVPDLSIIPHQREKILELLNLVIRLRGFRPVQTDQQIIDQIILIFTNTACVYNESNVYRFVDLNDLYLYSFINVFNPLFFIIASIYLIASSFINLLKKEDVKLYTETNKFIKQPKLDEKYFYSYKNLSFGLQYKPLP